MEKKQIKSLSEFREWTRDKQVNFAKPDFLWRGQENAEWGLEPTLSRLVLGKVLTPKPDKMRRQELENDKNKTELAMEIERGILPIFCRRTPYNPGDPPCNPWDPVSCWTFMQHYQCPTRLLDWTVSPEIALYFAVKEKTGGDEDGCIFCLNRKNLCDAMRALYKESYLRDYGKILSKHPEDIDSSDLPPKAKGDQIRELWYRKDSDPKLHTFYQGAEIPRMAHQLAWFTLCPSVLAEHESVLGELEAKGNCADSLLDKAFVPNANKDEVQEQLMSSGITEDALFPDLDGLGRHLDWISKRMIRVAEVGRR